MNAYSKDLRMRVLAAVDRGDPYAEVSRLLGVSLATIGRYVGRRRETGEVAPRPSPGRTPRICKSAEERRALWKHLKKNPEATLEEHRELWERKRGVRVSVATMSRAIRRLGWTYKQRRWRLPSARRAGPSPLARAGSASRPEEARLRGRVRLECRLGAAAGQGA